jgi:hypothetical protein
VLLAQLESGAQRRRHALALVLAIRSGGRVWDDTQSFTRVQRAALERARSADQRAFAFPFDVKADHAYGSWPARLIRNAPARHRCFRPARA